MKPRHHVSNRAIELIKRFEGYRRNAAVLADGRWTIGYGHVKTARAGAEVSESDAEVLLIYDLIEVNKAVNDWTFTPLTENQFDALVCFAFNIGLEAFRGSAVLRRVNEGNLLQAAYAIEMWRKADFEGERIVVDALVRRRAAEKALFLTPANGWVAAPSPVVRPRIDYDASSSQPKQKPMSLIVPLDGAEATAHQEIDPDAESAETVAQSPATVAAENLTARLQALVPDATSEETAIPDELAFVFAPDVGAEIDAAPVSQEPAASDEPAPDQFNLEEQPVTEQPSEEQVVETTAVVEPEAEPKPFGEPAAASDGFRPLAALAGVSPRLTQEDFTVRRSTLHAPDSVSDGPAVSDFAKLIGLGVVGLIFFSFAIISKLFAAPGSGVVGALLAGLIGFGCVICAVYLALQRIGGSEE